MLGFCHLWGISALEDLGLRVWEWQGLGARGLGQRARAHVDGGRAQSCWLSGQAESESLTPTAPLFLFFFFNCLPQNFFVLVWFGLFFGCIGSSVQCTGFSLVVAQA